MNTAIPIAAVLIVSGCSLHLRVGCGAGCLEWEAALQHGTSEGDSAVGLQTGQWSARLYAEGAPPPLQEVKGLGLPGLEDLRLSV